jgi:DNA polymerase III epsilon subunit-like protein
MLDIETTGTDPAHAAILQISAVKFSIETKEISHNFFDRCLAMPANRYWDEGTREWWLRQDEHILPEILGRAEDPAVVIKDFSEWIIGTLPVKDVRLWAKPISFEWPFIASYFKQFDVPLPLHYRHAKDLNTYIFARGHDINEFWKGIPFEGDAHNALYDVFHQIRGAFAA